MNQSKKKNNCTHGITEIETNGLKFQRKPSIRKVQGRCSLVPRLHPRGQGLVTFSQPLGLHLCRNAFWWESFIHQSSLKTVCGCNTVHFNTMTLTALVALMKPEESVKCLSSWVGPGHVTRLSVSCKKTTAKTRDLYIHSPTPASSCSAIKQPHKTTWRERGGTWLEDYLVFLAGREVHFKTTRFLSLPNNQPYFTSTIREMPGLMP